MLGQNVCNSDRISEAGFTKKGLPNDQIYLVAILVNLKTTEGHSKNAEAFKVV